MNRSLSIPLPCPLCRNPRFALAAMLILFCMLVEPASVAQSRFHIGGTVVNSVSGQPLAQARVFVSRAQERQEPEVVITGADGRFQFDDLPAGKYALGAGKPGFVMQGFEQHDDYSTAIVVGPGFSAEDLVFRVPPAAVISGQIVDEQSEPMRQAQVMLFRTRIEDGIQKMRNVGQTDSDDRGQYRFGSLHPGVYYVVVSARPWYAQYTPSLRNYHNDTDQAQSAVPPDSTYPITYYPGASDPTQASPLKVAAGDHVSADFALAPVRSLHLRIRTPKLNGSQGYNVLITPEAFQGVDLRMPISVETTMTRPGEVEITGVAPGQYRLQMVFPAKATSTYSQELDLQSDTEIDASTNSQSASISGIVKMQDGSRMPVQAAILLRNTSSGDTAFARILPDGQFEFDRNQALPPGTYDVAIGTQNVFLRSLSASGTEVVGRTIQVRGSNPIRLAIVAGTGVAQITGTAISQDDNKPVAAAMVLLAPDDPAHNTVLIRRDQSDSDGTFTLASVVPGHYTLLAIRNGWDLEWMNPAVLKRYIPGGEPINVQTNGKYNLKVRVQ
jgi:hypothetical protein